MRWVLGAKTGRSAAGPDRFAGSVPCSGPARGPVCDAARDPRSRTGAAPGYPPFVPPGATLGGNGGAVVPVAP